MARQRRQYALEFKQEAVQLVLQRGLTPAQVGRDLNIDRSLIRAWVEKSKAGQLVESPSPPAAPGLEEEVRRLRRENAILREEREILKNSPGGGFSPV
jgi:transposase